MTFKVIRHVSWVFLGADNEMEGAGLMGWGEAEIIMPVKHKGPEQDWAGRAADCDEDLTKPSPDQWATLQQRLPIKESYVDWKGPSPLGWGCLGRLWPWPQS